jgi:hypothetical protein|tara:strand:+ start:656 stop:931 length:276 start_codon:yes stop_codon:yes gene_type:complete
MDGWAGPTLGIFLISQLGAAFWWASGTDTQVKSNTDIISQVVVNDKNIAVVKNQQTNIMEDMVELKVMMTENQKLLQQIVIKSNSASYTSE